jgi:hypothetical protein
MTKADGAQSSAFRRHDASSQEDHAGVAIVQAFVPPCEQFAIIVDPLKLFAFQPIDSIPGAS